MRIKLCRYIDLILCVLGILSVIQYIDGNAKMIHIFGIAYVILRIAIAGVDSIHNSATGQIPDGDL